MSEASNSDMLMDYGLGTTVTLVPQSAAVTAEETSFITGSSSQGDSIQEVIEFLDENTGASNMNVLPPPGVVTDQAIVSDASLSAFLSRPVRIASFTWNESDPVGTRHTMSPWRDFFNDSRIKNKINNFAFLACNLKIKVLINASPFYYGAMLMNYQPLPALSPSTIRFDSGTRYFIPYSQRPHIWIYPQNSAGGEMALPYFHFRNFLRVQTAQDFIDMGTLEFVNYTTLQSANGVSGTGVTIQVYAWAENVQLSGSTVSLALQAKDEYSVSSIASAIAAISGKLSRIPIIGPYMTATQMGATAVAAGASAIGYTNVPVIDDIKPLKPTAFPSLASSEIGFPVEKLTLDPKNELTIDSRVLGLDGSDELSISSLVQKESYLTTTTFANYNVPDDMIFQCLVSPFLCDYESVTGGKAYYNTPMAFVGNLFEHWRGDIIFRFRFVTSPFHKGRVRISFDPQGTVAQNIAVDSVCSTVTYTKIVDIGKDTDIEFRVPYQQAISWCRCTGTIPTQYWSTSAVANFNRTEGYDNGFLTMRVLTALTAPVATAPIKILISVRGAENLEFANPGSSFNLDKTFSYLEPHSKDEYDYLVPQSMDEYDDGESQQLVAGSKSIAHPQRYLLNFGEYIPTLRSLLRRSTLSFGKNESQVGSNSIKTWLYVFGRSPVPYGYDFHGIDKAVSSLVPAAIMDFNWNNFHPITYVSLAFIGTRGSVNWIFNFDHPTGLKNINVQRVPFGNYTYGITTNVTSSGTGSGSLPVAAAINYTIDGSAGQAMTNQMTQSGLSVSIPNYTPYRFNTTRIGNQTNPQIQDGSSGEMNALEYTDTGVINDHEYSVKIWGYAGIGVDYNLHFFLNVPTLFSYSSRPIPV